MRCSSSKKAFLSSGSNRWEPVHSYVRKALGFFTRKLFCWPTKVIHGIDVGSNDVVKGGVEAAMEDAKAGAVEQGCRVVKALHDNAMLIIYTRLIVIDNRYS